MHVNINTFWLFRKRVGDLELEICDLQRKLENQNQTLLSLQVELQDKSSQLSVAQVRIQQVRFPLYSQQY